MGVEEQVVLTVNAGSSSVRLGLFVGTSRLRGVRVERAEPRPDLLDEILEGAKVSAVAHRIVHGGPRYVATCELTAEVESEIRRFSWLAPLHNPAALAWAALCRARMAEARELAVFDAALFTDLPDVARRYALPAALTDRADLRRLGFHGLAHRSMIERFAGLERVISLQLGGGCSAVAFRSGRPIDTSMGFTPLEGLVMSTRAGDLDPGLLMYLFRDAGMGAAELHRLLHEQSGLLALSGTTGDLRRLLADASPAAQQAIDLFCYRVRKYIGAYFAALGGCDAVLIGGGAGEHLPELRRRIFEGLASMGAEIDDAANAAADPPARISRASSRMAIWVVATDEETVLATEALAALV